MHIKLPLRRLCKKHILPIVSRIEGDREHLLCSKNHRCHGWLIVDAHNNWIGLGYREGEGEIFSIHRPLPVGLKDEGTEKLPIPLRPCKYGHLDWVRIKTSPKERYHCRVCNTQTFRKLKKEGKVNVVR